MKVEQISVFLENKAGRLLDVTLALNNANVNICASSLADTSDFGILRLLVDNIDRAKTVLKEGGFTVGTTEVVAVQLEDRPGALNRVLQILRDVDVNVEYMYAYARSGYKGPTLIFRFNHTDAAVKALNEQHIPMLAADQING